MGEVPLRSPEPPCTIVFSSHHTDVASLTLIPVLRVLGFGIVRVLGLRVVRVLGFGIVMVRSCPVWPRGVGRSLEVEV
jgi:hypothetical protein